MTICLAQYVHSSWKRISVNTDGYYYPTSFALSNSTCTVISKPLSQKNAFFHLWTKNYNLFILGGVLAESSAREIKWFAYDHRLSEGSPTQGFSHSAQLFFTDFPPSYRDSGLCFISSIFFLSHHLTDPCLHWGHYISETLPVSQQHPRMCI